MGGDPDVSRDIAVFSRFFYDVVDHGCGQRLCISAEKDIVRDNTVRKIGTAYSQKFDQPFAQHGRLGNHALLVALSPDDNVVKLDLFSVRLINSLSRIPVSISISITTLFRMVR